MRPNEREQGPRLERLAQIAARGAGSVAFGRHLVVRRHEDDRRRVAPGREQILKFESAQSAEVDIEDDTGGLSAGVVQEFLGGRERFHGDTVAPKRASECRAERRVVIDDTDPGLARCRRACRARFSGCRHEVLGR